MKNIVSTDDSVKSQITDSISENLTDSDLESTLFSYDTKINRLSQFSEKLCQSSIQSDNSIESYAAHNLLKIS